MRLAFHGLRTRLKNSFLFPQFFATDSGTTYDKRKEYRLKNAQRKSEYDRLHRLKNRERKNAYQRDYDSDPKNKERKKEKPLTPEKLEKRREKDRRSRLKNLDKHIQKKKENNPAYVYYKRTNNWRDPISVKTYFDKTGPLLGLNDLDTDSDLSFWYRVSYTQIRKTGGDGLLKIYPSLGFALKLAYPEFPWDMSKFPLRNKKAAQRWLVTLVKRLVIAYMKRSGIPITVVEDYRDNPLLRLEGSNRNLELDIYIPELNLSLEFQGEQHFQDFPNSKFRSLAQQQYIDIEKKKLCEENGITIVYVPFWWDETADSLTSTLNQHLPSVFPISDSPPIPTEMPPDYKDKRKRRLHNKLLMHGCDYEPNTVNVKGYFMSEKLDGMRAYWDGTQFWTRNDSVINVPELFKVLPPIPLDGEFWCGYEESDVMYHVKLNCGKKKKIDTDWTPVIYCVFDAPLEEGTYEKRHSYLRNNFTHYCNSNIKLIPMQTCEGEEHLQKYLDEIIAKGGEGIMIHHPDLHYQPGRTQKLLKVKKHFESEVTFLDVNPNSYSLLCEQENGARIFVKCSSAQYFDSPPVGTKITVRHQGFYPKSQKYRYPVLQKISNSDKLQNPKNMTLPKTKKKANNENIE
jgi:DNA ligase-1